MSNATLKRVASESLVETVLCKHHKSVCILAAKKCHMPEGILREIEGIVRIVYISDGF